jgi:hypothetical protein
MRDLTQVELDQVSGGAQPLHFNMNENNLNINIKEEDLRLHLIINNNILIKIRTEELKLNLRFPA